MGGLGPSVDGAFLEQNVFALSDNIDHHDPPHGIYYSGVGMELIYNIQTSTVTEKHFDLYVVNTTRYIPHQVLRNGLRDGTGDFAVVNLADGQSCSFNYSFVQPASGELYTLSQNYTVWFVDLDVGQDGFLSESVRVCGVAKYSLSTDTYGVESSLSVEKLEGDDCYRFSANDFGSGDNNPAMASEIFVPLDQMTKYTVSNVLPNLVALTFGSGTSGFEIEYTVSPAKRPNTSGRNFLFTSYTPAEKDAVL
eukprot:2950294-Pleurochrysis_carterae.AAC.1